MFEVGKYYRLVRRSYHALPMGSISKCMNLDHFGEYNMARVAGCEPYNGHGYFFGVDSSDYEELSEEESLMYRMSNDS